jgi:hypothetical protein
MSLTVWLQGEIILHFLNQYTYNFLLPLVNNNVV